MKKSSYQALHDAIEARAAVKKTVVLCTKLLPLPVYLLYPLFLLYVLILKRELLLYAVLVPLTAFLLCTVWRRLQNAPRPYEVLQIPAIVPKETSGKSFPSRHAASAAVIAVTALPVLPGIGVLLLVLSVLIVLTRVLAGVHFIRDVVCGWLLGAVTGLLGMLLFL